MPNLGFPLRARASPLRSADPGSDPGSDPPTSGLLGVIGGVAARKRLHALHPAHPGHEAATAGFALALALSLQRSPDAPVLWVQEGQAAAEAGRPYGYGLAGLGFDPARLVVVAVKGAMDALAAAEMGLEEAGLAGVLVDLPQRLPADMLRLGKRLSLRAEARGTPCFLLHAGGEAVEAPVATRWSVKSGSGQQAAGSSAIPLPAARCLLPDFTTAFDIMLSKNRFGALGRWSVVWQAQLSTQSSAQPVAFESHRHAPASPAVRRFAFVDAPQALSQPLAAPVADGSVAPPRGTLLSWPTAA